MTRRQRSAELVFSSEADVKTMGGDQDQDRIRIASLIGSSEAA
jgi:hypothetical protein